MPSPSKTASRKRKSGSRNPASAASGKRSSASASAARKRTTRSALDVTEEQVLWFRARRGHLAGPGARSAVEAVRALLGAQSQQLPPSLFGISQRVRGRPTAAALATSLFGPKPSLVRTWGQRDTLFVFDTRDWPTVVAARERWQPGGRGGPVPDSATLDKALARVEKAKRPVTRSDLVGVAPKRYVAALAERAQLAGMAAERLAAARIAWSLSNQGRLRLGPKVGAEQSYVLHARRMPRRPPGPAALEMARRYLAAYGPATPQDLSHFFNATVARAREWLATLAGDLVPVACGARTGLVVLAEDASDLARRPPSDASRWPIRLLPLWDSLLMGHADKSWTVPVDAERKVVWRKAGYVAAVALARGRVVATWKHTLRRKRVVVHVTPARGWRKTRHASGVRSDAVAFAAHLGLAEAEVVVDAT